MNILRIELFLPSIFILKKFLFFYLYLYEWHKYTIN